MTCVSHLRQSVSAPGDSDDQRTIGEEGSASTHCDDEEDSMMLGLGG